MNEIAANIAVTPADKIGKVKQPLNSKQKGLIGYGVLAVATLAGWLLRELNIVDPARGLGYWLGIIGGSMMLLLLFYPVVKKSRLMQRMGLLKHWFRIHMILGLVGPLLVLYHCNFQVSAINSTVALYSMLIVAASGIIGKHFYARIHRGLYGRRTTIEELRNEMADAVANSRGIAAILPNFISRLHAITEELVGDQYTRRINLRRSLTWAVKHHFVRLRLYLQIRRELRARAVLSETIHGNVPELRRIATQYMTDQVRLMRRIAQLAFYERLFSLWHVFHLPLFALLVLSSLVHVFAVHMY